MGSPEATKTMPLLPRGQGNLLSPEEHIVHSFSSENPEANRAVKLPPLRALQSPPTTPQDNSLPHFAPSPTADQPLFRSQSPDASIHSESPLFDSDSRPTSSGDDYPVVNPGRTAGLSGPIPTDWQWRAIEQMGKERYAQMLADQRHEFYERATAKMNTYVADREAREGRTGGKRRLPEPRRSPALERDDVSKRQLSALTRPAKITKSKALPKLAKSAKATIPVSPDTEKTARTPKRTPKQRTHHDFDDRSSAGPGQAKHKRAAPSKKLDGTDDSQWRDLLDYCPPVDALKEGTKLKVSWRGNPAKFEHEPDADQLNSAEAAAAAELRLKPQQYLANKRRLFQARVAALKEGRHFNKTLAQTAMKIDVNKSSKMWEMFDKVGWLEESWFEKYL